MKRSLQTLSLFLALPLIWLSLADAQEKSKYQASSDDKKMSIILSFDGAMPFGDLSEIKFFKNLKNKKS